MPNSTAPKNAVQAKYLFETAVAAWEPHRDFSNGLVVSLLQDSMELLLWDIVKATNPADLKDKNYFSSLITKKYPPDNRPLHGVGFAIEINEARVKFKHYGVTPARADVPRLIDEARYFLQRNAKEFLGISFDGVSLADDVSDLNVRKHLKDAEKLRDNDELKEALISASLAFQEIAGIGRRRNYSFEFDLDGIDLLFPKECHQAAHERLGDVANALERFFGDYALLSLGVSADLRDELMRRVWQVNISQSGVRLDVVITNGAEATLENVNFLISTLTEIGRKLPVRNQ